nr:sulfur relay protein DsrC [Thioalkalivibrio sp.]
MIWLSEMLMQNQDLESFQQLIDLVQERAREGERFLSSDVRPPFPDTPMDWEERIEAAFTSPNG